MKNRLSKSIDVNSFNIWKYPVFAMSMGYVWLELLNPLIGFKLQLIPMVPNSAIAIIILYFIRPDYIKKIYVLNKTVKWALPFLILATINLPFIDIEQERSIKELIMQWFWILFLVPLAISCFPGGFEI